MPLKASLFMLDDNCGITYPRKPNTQLQKQDLRNLSEAIAKGSAHCDWSFLAVLIFVILQNIKIIIHAIYAQFCNRL